MKTHRAVFLALSWLSGFRDAGVVPICQETHALRVEIPIVATKHHISDADVPMKYLVCRIMSAPDHYCNVMRIGSRSLYITTYLHWR